MNLATTENSLTQVLMSVNASPMSSSVGNPGRPSNSNHIQTDGHHHSVEDYSRIMLEYTQRRMDGLAGPDKYNCSSRSRNHSGLLAGQASGQPISKYRRDSDNLSGTFSASPHLFSAEYFSRKYGSDVALPRHHRSTLTGQGRDRYTNSIGVSLQL
ncbi:hypothetical protein BDW59DRAFT_161358 [Aspergillus cavernicola]|uniref:Uncharacterized protein n=1 Tax=Aspergillus cavernicola TaxID=176166 RepID=A0ABR4IE31_9EURO